MRTMMNKPFKKIGFLGIGVILMSLVLMAVFPTTAPWMMDGFFTPIIAFEFIGTTEEVFQFFGSPDSPEYDPMIEAMDLGNRLDFIYMVLYSLFLLLFARQCVKLTGNRLFYLSMGLALVVLIGDFLENLQLLEITSKLSSGNFEEELQYLRIFTWQKWGGLTVYFVTLLPYFFEGGPFSKILSGMGVGLFVFGEIAYMHRSVLNEILGLSIAVMFVLMIIYCFRYEVSTVELE